VFGKPLTSMQPVAEASSPAATSHLTVRICFCPLRKGMPGLWFLPDR
jgi:hypothetical protein